MMRKTCWAWVALAALGHAIQVPADHAVHEKRSVTSQRWVKGSRIHPESILPMRIGLAQNMDQAVEKLMDVSDPASPNYGRHWSSERVIEHFQPSKESVNSVGQWLDEFGIEKKRITHSDNRGWLAFDITTSEAEGLLKTEFYEYEDTMTGAILAACDSYHVPIKIQKHLDYITPGIQLMAPLNKSATKHQKRRLPISTSNRGFTPPALREVPQGLINDLKDLTMCDVIITPVCINALYSILPPSTKLPVSSNNTMGIFESIQEYYAQEDLNEFFTNFTYPLIPNGTHPSLISIDGGLARTSNLSYTGTEVSLDLQLAYPLVYPQAISIFSEDDPVYQVSTNFSGGFNTFLDAIDGSYCTYTAFGITGDSPGLDPPYPDPNPGGYKGPLQCGVYKPTNVISISYAGKEALLSANYQKRQCNEFLKLGLQGVSIFFASGDAGVGDYPAPYGSGGAEDPATGCLGPEGTIFNPSWPISCPWLTSVGATKVYPGQSVFGKEPESAVYDPAGHPYAVNYSSGGGFSNLYAIPDYQKSAVATYFQDHDPGYKYYSALVDNINQISALGMDGGVYNRIGRGIPDVAAVGDNIAIYNGGKLGLSGGTSAATPIFASIINRVNEDRIRLGKGPVGFVNPVLYKNPGVFRDITNGSNPGCLTQGFSAVPGWDPVTGLGTPNFPKILELFLSLP